MAHVNGRLGDRRRVDDGDRAGAIVAEGQKQRETVARIDLERTRLGVAKPSLRHQIREVRVKPLFADVRRGSRRQGKGYLRMLALKVGGVVGEYATSARLLTQLACEEIVVVDLAPEYCSHINYILYCRL